MTRMTRAEHIRAAKERAIALLDAGDARAAYRSMSDDLHMHPETRDMMYLLSIVGLQALNDGEKPLRDWIVGFAE